MTSYWEHIRSILRDLETHITQLLCENKDKILSQSIIQEIQSQHRQILTLFQHDLLVLTKEFEHEKEVNDFLLVQLQTERHAAETLIAAIQELQKQIEILSDKDTKSLTYSISYIDLLPDNEANVTTALSEKRSVSKPSLNASPNSTIK